MATPAGLFKGCYVLQVVNGNVADAGFGTFTFAAGIGLVQFDQISIVGTKVYSLRSAKIRGIDGKTYFIGKEQ